jgi:hypothetical protein
MRKDPQNCPYCEAEEKGVSSGWSGSPEFWASLKEKHNKEHCERCPACGQPLF